ncbi:MAG TPA: host attachment protein [Xanthomonadales bacterium]|nr:host attachment protein [Xanthomonadales bacterium]
MATTWVLVADKSRARLLAAYSNDAQLVEIAAFQHDAGRAHGRELVTDKPPRLQGKLPGQRHGVEAETDPRRVEAERFAKLLAEHLDEGRARDAFDRLYLVAPPEFLGLLRVRLGKETESRLAGSVNKELTQDSADQIRDYLPRALVISEEREAAEKMGFSEVPRVGRRST